MRCRKSKRLLIPYLEHHLTGAVSEELKAHLDSCGACRAELEELKQIGNLLRENLHNSHIPEYGLSMAPALIRHVFPQPAATALPWRLVRQPVVIGLMALGLAICSYLVGSINRPVIDNNDIQFYLESYNQVSGVEIIAFGESEER